MARPIKEFKPKERPIEEIREENLDHILNQLADNHEAVQQVLTIIQELYESGLLDIVKSLLATRSEVGEVAMKQINQPKTLNILNNIMGASELLGSIDPDELNRMFAGLSAGMQEASKEGKPEKPMGVMGMMKATKDPNIQASLQTMFKFLEGMGGQLNQNSRKSE